MIPVYPVQVDRLRQVYCVPVRQAGVSAARLAGLPAPLVGVRRPLAVILERQRATGWDAERPIDAPAPKPVRLWQEEVHHPGMDDLEVDTSRWLDGQRGPTTAKPRLRAAGL